MKNNFEHILLSILLGLSVLLGLSFWLNTCFGFNLFLKEHWDMLAKLQASNTPINIWFYIAICLAIFIFLTGMIIINIPLLKNKRNKITREQITPAPTISTIKPSTPEPDVIPEPIGMPVVRPPRLNLPKNMAEIATKRHEGQQIVQTKTQNSSQQSPYNSLLNDIFTNAKYLIKPNPTISGFTPNLFAIGNNEIIWIGGVDCDLKSLQDAIQKLNSVFEDTLPDIPIHIRAFIIDNLNTIQSVDDSVMIFHSIDDLKKFISENPADDIDGNEQESFDSYSEYIDTIIQYIKNL